MDVYCRPNRIKISELIQSRLRDSINTPDNAELLAPPSQLRVLEISPTSFTVSWRPSLGDVGDGNTLQYLVNVTDTQEESVVLPRHKIVTTALQLRVGELLPDHIHQVSIAVISEEEVGRTVTVFVKTCPETAQTAVTLPPPVDVPSTAETMSDEPDGPAEDSVACSTQPVQSSPFQFDVSTDELDLANLPFHDQSKFTLRIPPTQDYVDERAVRRLVASEKMINNPADWFTELSHLFLEGQGEDQKEHVAVYLLNVMGSKKLLHSVMFPQMSLLYEILSPKQQFNFLARCTLFVAAVYKIGLTKVLEEVERGSTILHYAAQLGYRTIIRLLCKWGMDVNMRSSITSATPLLTAVSPNHLNEGVTKRTVTVLLQCGARESINTENDGGDSPLFMAVLRRQDGVVNQLLGEGADRSKLDKGGNTILHIAAQVNAVDVCEMLMAMDDSDKMVATKNVNGQTPIHLAAMHSPRCLKKITFTLPCSLGKNYAKHVEWFSAPDSSDCTPLDIAAKAGQKETFAYMWEEMERYSPAHIEVECRKLQFLIEEAEKDPSQWQRVIDYLNLFPKRMLHRLLLDDGADDKKPSFHRLIKASKNGTAADLEQGHQGAVRAVLDSSLFGDKVIVTRTLDGASRTAQFKLGLSCAGRDTRHLPQGSNLAALSNSDLQVWDHQAMTLWLNQKLKSYGMICILLYCFLYWVFLGIACVALEVAGDADLTVTSEQVVSYTNDHGHGNQQQALEIAAVILWFMFLTLDFLDLLRFGMYYWKWFGVYPRLAVNLCFLALIVTRLCGHSSQWVWASLFVICAAVRAMEVFTVWKWSSVYLVTLWIIVRRELLKFLIIAVLSIFAFSAALRFALQAERHEAFRLLSTPANQSGVCAPVGSLLENGTNTTCVRKASLTQTLASHLLEELESLHNLFFANFRSLARGTSELRYSTGDGLEGYQLFTALVYLAFLGLVVLLLVSVFIAQATASYNSVQAIADQMANYSSARLLTQTSSMLPMLLITFITRNVRFTVLAYVWSDWPCHGGCCSEVRILRSAWRIIQSVLVTESSLLKIEDNHRNFDDLKSEMEELKTALQLIPKQLPVQQGNQQH